MNEIEKQLYELLMEIKESQVRLIVTSEERAEVARSHHRRITALEEKVDEMAHNITSINAGCQAWAAAFAAIGASVGWLLHHFLNGVK